MNKLIIMMLMVGCTTNQPTKTIAKEAGYNVQFQKGTYCLKEQPPPPIEFIDASIDLHCNEAAKKERF